MINVAGLAIGCSGHCARVPGGPSPAGGTYPLVATLAFLATLAEGRGPRRGSRSGADPDYRCWHLPLAPGLLDLGRPAPGVVGPQLGTLRSPLAAAPAEGPGSRPHWLFQLSTRI